MATAKQTEPELRPIDRFRRDLDALIEPGEIIGLAVSGGPDSLALLLLAAEARPLLVEAATVDHGLRPESRAEAEMVAKVCERLGVPHRILTATWDEKPATAIQERARMMRYRLLGEWVRERGLTALLTAHHVDDQAETFLMRLARGAGVKGLAGMRRLERYAWKRLRARAPACWDGAILSWRRFAPPPKWSRRKIRATRTSSSSECACEKRSPARTGSTPPPWRKAPSISRKQTGRCTGRPTSNGGERSVGRRRDRLQADRCAARDPQTDHPPGDPGARDRGRRRRAEGPRDRPDPGGASHRRRATLRGVLCVGGPEWHFSRAPARRAANASAEVSAIEG